MLIPTCLNFHSCTQIFYEQHQEIFTVIDGELFIRLPIVSVQLDFDYQPRIFNNHRRYLKSPKHQQSSGVSHELMPCWPPHTYM
jgi:hypothetical protein